jgi:hypothetical protein
MRCREPGESVAVAIHTSRTLGRWAACRYKIAIINVLFTNTSVAIELSIMQAEELIEDFDVIKTNDDLQKIKKDLEKCVLKK